MSNSIFDNDELIPISSFAKGLNKDLTELILKIAIKTRSLNHFCYPDSIQIKVCIDKLLENSKRADIQLIGEEIKYIAGIGALFGDYRGKTISLVSRISHELVTSYIDDDRIKLNIEEGSDDRLIECICFCKRLKLKVSYRKEERMFESVEFLDNV